MSERVMSEAEALESALGILDYGCDYGDYDPEAAAVRSVLAERDRLRGAAEALLRAWDDFNDPDLRVGPVWPRMNDLRAALKS